MTEDMMPFNPEAENENGDYETNNRLEWEKVRAETLKEDGTRDPEMRATFDPEWIKAHPYSIQRDGIHDYGIFDIANSEFEDLPKEWMLWGAWESTKK